jgi:hypothetical protein
MDKNYLSKDIFLTFFGRQIVVSLKILSHVPFSTLPCFGTSQRKARNRNVYAILSKSSVYANLTKVPVRFIREQILIFQQKANLSYGECIKIWKFFPIIDSIPELRRSKNALCWQNLNTCEATLEILNPSSSITQISLFMFTQL